jgi:hypothetical protein
MDAVYISRGGSNEELRYSIRSTLQNLPVSNIIIVGEAPDWYQGRKVHVPQKPDLKYLNAMNNLRAICRTKWISNEFVLMNDDFYTIKKLETIPNYNGGLLIDKVSKYNELAPYSSYTRKLTQTYRVLKRNGVSEPLDYEMHMPMQMTKSGLKKSIYPGIFWRSLYGNTYLKPGETVNDVKVYNSHHAVDKSYDYKNGDLPFLSSEDSSFSMLKKDLLREMFPDPCKLENKFKTKL